MKLPKKSKRFCPKCNKNTEQKADVVSSTIKRGPLAWGSLTRARLRGKNRGMGNHGRYSKPAIKSWKRKTKANTRKVVKYTCMICKKSTLSKSRRVSKIQIE
jgi:ribosomal protein L44E